MKQVVCDASFCAPWVLWDEGSPLSLRVRAGIEAASIQAHVPALWNFELINLLGVAVRRGRLTDDQADTALAAIMRLGLEIHSVDLVTSQRILRLAREHDLTAYDAAYLELADRLRLPLLTFDQALRAAGSRLKLPSS